MLISPIGLKTKSIKQNNFQIKTSANFTSNEIEKLAKLDSKFLKSYYNISFTSQLKDESLISPKRKQELLDFQEKYNLEFKDIELLNEAFTHTSYARKNNLKSQKRLVFYGDHILKRVATELFFNNLSDPSEGELELHRQAFMLNIPEYAQRIGLRELTLTKNPNATRKTMLTYSFKALVGAIYVNYGEKEGYKKILELLANNSTEELLSFDENIAFLTAINKLQTYSQRISEKYPEYVVKTMDSDCAQTICVDVKINGEVLGSGISADKKQAKALAAFNALKRLNLIDKSNDAEAIENIFQKQLDILEKEGAILPDKATFEKEQLPISPERKQQLLEFQQKYNLDFKDLSLLNQAFIHRSYTDDNDLDKSLTYERLEHYGDAILDQVIADLLIHDYKNFYNLENIIKIRDIIASNAKMTKFAKKLQLQDLVLYQGEINLQYVSACVFEALIGAICLNYGEDGIEKAKEFLKDNFENQILSVYNMRKLLPDKQKFLPPKTLLSNYTMKIGAKPPKYVMTNYEGPKHNPTFYMDVQIENETIASGVGYSKKEAERMAAINAIEKLGLI